MQTILFVIGSSAIGACAGFIMAFGICLLFPSRPGEWGGGILAVFLLVAFPMVGAVAGAFQGYRWVTQRAFKRWKESTWVGIALGMVLGWSLEFLYTGLAREITRFWWLAFIPIVAFGMLGGIAGTYITSMDRKIVPRPLARKKGRKKTQKITVEESE